MSQHGKNFTVGPTDRAEIILSIAMLKQAKFGIGRLPPGLAISHNFKPNALPGIVLPGRSNLMRYRALCTGAGMHGFNL